MDVLVEQVAGLDVHSKTVVASVHTPKVRETRTFGTMTGDLREMARWLAACEVSHVVMESTGPYWWPVYNVLEEAEGFELIVTNAQHVKAVPGRKTEVGDAEWLCSLLRHGLIRASFIPDKSQRELRELVRYRKKVIQERASEVQRVQKTLESANVKLASVASDVLGVSGRQMLEAMVAGVSEAKTLAAMAKGRLRDKQVALEQALEGMVGAHHRFIIREQLRHIDELDARIARLSEEIAERIRPFEQAVQRLDTVPGIGRHTAEMIVAEIGVDMSRFRTADHLASWAGVCPGNNESAGKRRSGKTRKGDGWLREAMVEAAWAASRTRSSYLNAQYHRLAGRRGKKRALVAVAHSMIIAIWHILADGESYKDLGYDYFDQRDKDALARRMTRRLEALGYKVTIDVA